MKYLLIYKYDYCVNSNFKNSYVTPDTGFSLAQSEGNKIEIKSIFNNVQSEPLTMLPHDLGHLIRVANFRLLCFRHSQYDFERDMQHNPKFKSAQIRY